MALEQVIDVLSDTCCKCAVLTDTLPKGKQEVCRIFVLEQELDFINKDECCLTLRSVLRDTVENTVHYDKHTD